MNVGDIKSDELLRFSFYFFEVVLKVVKAYSSICEKSAVIQVFY